MPQIVNQDELHNDIVQLLNAGQWAAASTRNAKAGKRRIKIPNATLSWADLAGAKLRYADLSGADLIGTNLSGADLTGADLTSARLTGANLSGANLTKAKLGLARLADANLSRANLTNARLAWVDLRSARLDGAIWTETDLSYANLPPCFLLAGTRLDAVPWVGIPSGWRAIASPRGARFLPSHPLKD